MSDGTFSVGIAWKYYDKDEPLFVTSKYANLKEETLNSKCINIEQYKTEISPKAEAYHKTKLAQSYTSIGGYIVFTQKNDRIHVPCDKVISKESLISIILYTDYTKFSTNFTSTFRKRNTFEPIQETKRRHRNAVITKSTPRSLKGPFYCGMSQVMRIPQFAITLSSPTSTSCQIAVATKFSGHKGFVLEFNNASGIARASRGFDVSWLSRFKEEDERYELHQIYFFILFYFIFLRCI